jgi:hypothetical protein
MEPSETLEEGLKRIDNQMIKDQLQKAVKQSEFAGGLNLSSAGEQESLEIMREKLNSKEREV